MHRDNTASLWRQGNGTSEWFPNDTAQKKVIFFLRGIDFLSKSFDSGVKRKWSPCLLKLVLARGFFFFKDASRVHLGAGGIALLGESLPSMHRDLGFILSPHINQAWCWHILVILACVR